MVAQHRPVDFGNTMQGDPVELVMDERVIDCGSSSTHGTVPRSLVWSRAAIGAVDGSYGSLLPSHANIGSSCARSGSLQ